jgi:hypothetical protein
VGLLEVNFSYIRNGDNFFPKPRKIPINAEYRINQTVAKVYLQEDINISHGEEQYFKSRSLEIPKRFSDCRKARRVAKEQERYYACMHAWSGHIG